MSRSGFYDGVEYLSNPGFINFPLGYWDLGPLSNPISSTPNLLGSEHSRTLISLLTKLLNVTDAVTIGKPGDQRTTSQLLSAQQITDVWVPAVFYKDVDFLGEINIAGDVVVQNLLTVIGDLTVKGSITCQGIPPPEPPLPLQTSLSFTNECHVYTADPSAGGEELADISISPEEITLGLTDSVFSMRGIHNLKNYPAGLVDLAIMDFRGTTDVLTAQSYQVIDGSITTAITAGDTKAIQIEGELALYASGTFSGTRQPGITPAASLATNLMSVEGSGIAIPNTPALSFENTSNNPVGVCLEISGTLIQNTMTNGITADISGLASRGIVLLDSALWSAANAIVIGPTGNPSANPILSRTYVLTDEGPIVGGTVDVVIQNPIYEGQQLIILNGTAGNLRFNNVPTAEALATLAPDQVTTAPTNVTLTPGNGKIAFQAFTVAAALRWILITPSLI